MSLASDFDAACDALHHVMNYEKFYSPDRYQITIAWGVNRATFRPLFPNLMHWNATTPPAVIDIELYEHFIDPSDTDPIAKLHFVIIDCVPTITFLGTSHWWYGLSLTAQFANNTPFNIRWAHIQLGNQISSSIGMYKYPFVE